MKTTLLKLSMFLIFVAISGIANAQYETIKFPGKKGKEKVTSSHSIFPATTIASENSSSQSKEQITFTWKGKQEGQRTIGIFATYGEDFTIDWGNGDPVTSYTGKGNEHIMLTSPVYGDNDEYTVIIKADNCSFTNLELGNYSELNEISELDISLAPNLIYLDCSSNMLTNLEVSKNTELISLTCIDNQLTTLEVSKNTKLTHLFCYYNSLSELIVSENKELTWLDCSYNQLTALDISQNNNLEFLYCENNELTHLDVHLNKELSYLQCSENQISSLNLSQNTNLTGLICYSNLFDNLDVNQNTSLTELNCSHNQLTVLDISHNSLLNSLFCEGNQLTTLDVSQHEELQVLYCHENSLTTLVLHPNAIFTELVCFDNALTLLDLYAISLVCSDEENFFPGTQIWEIHEVETENEIDLSSQAKLGDPKISTLFTIEKVEGDIREDINYIITEEGKLTFLNEGDYTVGMTNEAIISHPYFPAEVVAHYRVKDEITNIKENHIQSFQLYPNPVSDKLYIQLNEELTGHLRIYDITGRIAIENSYIKDNIDVSSLPEGVYIVKLVTTKGESIRRFIKE